MKWLLFSFFAQDDGAGAGSGGDAGAAAAAKVIAGAGSGNPSSGGKQDAPANGKGDQPGAGGSQKADEVDLEGLLSRELGLGGSEETLDTVKVQLAASSKEAKRLKAVNDSVLKLLEGQGLDVVTDKDGKLLGIKAKAARDETGKFKADPDAPDYDKLTNGEQDEFASNPKAAIAKLWKKAMETAKSHYATVSPTVDPKREPPTQAVMDAAVVAVKGMKDLSGKPVFEDLDALLPTIQSLTSKLPPELLEAFNAHPQTMLSLLASKAQESHTRLKAWAEDQKARKAQAQADAQRAAGVLPGGEGTVNLAGSDAAKAAAKLIAKAV